MIGVSLAFLAGALSVGLIVFHISGIRRREIEMQKKLLEKEAEQARRIVADTDLRELVHRSNERWRREKK